MERVSWCECSSESRCVLADGVVVMGCVFGRRFRAINVLSWGSGVCDECVDNWGKGCRWQRRVVDQRNKNRRLEGTQRR